MGFHEEVRGKHLLQLPEWSVSTSHLGAPFVLLLALLTGPCGGGVYLVLASVYILAA